MNQAQELNNKRWPRNSAGRWMTKRVPIVQATFSTSQTRALIQFKAKDYEAIDYIYLTDKDHKLNGVISIRDLFVYPPETKVHQITKDRPLISVKPQSNQAEIAYMVIKYGIKAVPVIDNQGVLLGVVPHDKVRQILYQEFRSDILYLAGVHKQHVTYDNVLKTPTRLSIWHRIPWLIIGLLGGLLAAQIVGFFENTLEKNLILAAFIPLVVYIADAVGTQLEAFTIRDFAVFRKLDFSQYFLKQLAVVLGIAVILGGIISILSLVIYREMAISVVLGIAIASAVISALFTGLFIPYIFRAFRIDPADASGPIGTIIQDILSVLIYFLIASLIL